MHELGLRLERILVSSVGLLACEHVRTLKPKKLKNLKNLIKHFKKPKNLKTFLKTFAFTSPTANVII